MPRASRQRSGTSPGLKVAVGALAALLVGALFVPRGGDDDRAVRPSAAAENGDLADASAGPSAVTPEAQAEIDRVVTQGLTSARGLSARSPLASLAASQVRCADFEGQRYCLHSGWTTASPSDVVADVSAEASRAAARRTADQVTTGDRDLASTLRATAALAPSARAAADRAELTAAARSVAKVWLLRNQIQGIPLPEGFLSRHPEVTVPTDPAAPAAKATASPSATPSAGAAPVVKTNKDYPRGSWILDARKVAEQAVTYYCGPTSMQMIAWNWSGTRKSQNHWADQLGTTSSGSAITDMVRVTNAVTGWDRPAYAGPYIVLDIKDFTYRQWMLLNMRHIVDYKAPLIFHPILLKEFYPYLDDNASGHFQVGRGYNKRGAKANLVSYFEPWNQQRFDPSEPYIARVQNRSAYKSYRANLAHFQHNIGV
ncbi:C39 family peptidase [Nocardioides sp.]|uniref:C39 family peptidase n=1 Tax=Nocardioides sp. TaxID=35761 RepID=UPI003D14780B